MKKRKLVSIVIPVYNEKDFIAKTVKRVLESDTLDYKKEIIIVDDGSTDGTSQILRKISKNQDNIKVYYKENAGKGSSLKLGFQKTKGNIVLVQDADLEYDPNDYPLLLKPFLDNNADIVYGSRLVTAKPHRVLYFWHYILNKLLTNLSNLLTNLNLTDMETGYKVFKGDIIRKLAKNLQSKKFGFEPEITAKISKIKNIKIFEVGISYSGRTYEEGKKINWKDGIKAVYEIIKFNLQARN